MRGLTVKIYQVIPTKRNFKNIVMGIISFFLTIKKINPDIIIQRAGGYITCLCSIYKLLYHKKFIFSIVHKNDTIKGGKKGINGIAFRFGMRYADVIIAQSNEQISELRKWKHKIPLHFVIKSGHRFNKEAIVKNEIILWVGKAVKFKRSLVFLKLVKNFPNQKFIMICPKSNNQRYWDKIYRIANKYKNLKFIEYVPFNEIDRFFKLAKIFINTSTYEGFPNTFIQSLKNCTPIISLNVDPDNIIKKYNVGFFCNDDISKAELYLQKLIEDKDLYKNISQNAYLHALNNYDIEAISKIWANLIIYLFNTYKKCGY